MVVTMPRGRPLTIADLHRFPDDGNRYELIEGSLHVNPAPNPAHQRALSNLFVVLREACPEHLEVFFAPFDVILGPDTLVQPDLLIVATADLDPDALRRPPLLAVEVLSPSTRRYDLGTKRTAYEQAGVPVYWTLDPDPQAPSLSVIEWGGGRLIGEQTVSGVDTLEVSRPYDVRLCPADLVAPGGRRA